MTYSRYRDALASLRDLDKIPILWHTEGRAMHSASREGIGNMPHTGTQGSLSDGIHRHETFMAQLAKQWDREQEENRNMEIGDKITVKKGWEFYNTETFESRTADGTETGVITKAHKHPGTLYFRLENGQIASGAINGMDKR